jgi:hypothetical protein
MGIEHRAQLQLRMGPSPPHAGTEMPRAGTPPCQHAPPPRCSSVGTGRAGRGGGHAGTGGVPTRGVSAFSVLAPGIGNT